jgi:hypothetical protein
MVAVGGGRDNLVKPSGNMIERCFQLDHAVAVIFQTECGRVGFELLDARIDTACPPRDCAGLQDQEGENWPVGIDSVVHFAPRLKSVSKIVAVADAAFSAAVCGWPDLIVIVHLPTQTETPPTGMCVHPVSDAASKAAETIRFT